LGVPKVELVKLRRVTWGSVFNFTLLVVASYTIIAMLTGIDFEELGDALKELDAEAQRLGVSSLL